MARLRPIEPSQADDQTALLFAGPLKGRHFNAVKALAASPAALAAAADVEQRLHASSLSPLQRVAIRLVVAQHLGSTSDLAHAGHDAFALGLAPDQITKIRRGVPVKAELDAIVAFTRALLDKRGRVSDQDASAIRIAGFDDRLIADLLAQTGLAWSLCLFNVFNGTPPDFPPLAEV